MTKTKEIREKVRVEGLEHKNIVDVEVMPNIVKEHKSKNRIVYEGELELRFLLSNDDLQIDTRMAKIPFDYALEGIEDGESMNTDMTVEVMNQDFIVQDGGEVTSNIDLAMNENSYRSTNMNIMDEIQTNGEREAEDYSILMYIVKKGDTLWKIAKRFGSTVEDIVRTNGIQDENKIDIGQKIFIPHYSKTSVMSNG